MFLKKKYVFNFLQHRKINIFIVRPYSRNYLHLDHMNCKIPQDQLEDRFFKWGEGFLNLLLWDPFEGARPRLSVPVEKENAARLYQYYTGPFGSNKLRAEVARTLQVGRRLSSS